MIVVFPAEIDVLGMFTEAVTVVGAPDADGHIEEIGISKIGIEVVSPDVVTESPPPLLVLLPLLFVVLLLLAVAFFFFDPPDLPLPPDDLSLPVSGGGTKPAATACAFNSFCRFSACDFACFRRWSFR